MNTVGYGDISPQTTEERFVGIFLLILASFVFAYTLNSIGAAL
jgi:hyperpolarization activated cyclic nucleotide-gated potassium channel 2